MSRNTSIEEHFQRLAREHKPKFRFCGENPGHWKEWRESLLPALKQTLGKMPQGTALNPELVAEWEHDGLIKQRILFDVEPGLATTALLYRPAEPARVKFPGILACHGHGPFGKDAVMGDRSDPARSKNIDEFNYDYGLQMAKAGFAVIAIDWRGFGDRDDRCRPHCKDNIHGRDICNVHFIRESMFGRTLLGSDIHDGIAALECLCSQDFVDATRIGVMGLSFGGTMATWLSLCDERIKAANIIGYSDRFADFAIRDANFCGSQMSPGLFDLCDVSDLHGMIAPRPLLVEIGMHDRCFTIDSALACFREVAAIYSAAGVREKLELDLFEGGHRWGGHKSVSFFCKYLGVPQSRTISRANHRHSKRATEGFVVRNRHTRVE